MTGLEPSGGHRRSASVPAAPSEADVERARASFETEMRAFVGASQETHRDDHQPIDVQLPAEFEHHLLAQMNGISQMAAFEPATQNEHLAHTLTSLLQVATVFEPTNEERHAAQSLVAFLHDNVVPAASNQQPAGRITVPVDGSLRRVGASSDSITSLPPVGDETAVVASTRQHTGPREAPRTERSAPELDPHRVATLLVQDAAALAGPNPTFEQRCAAFVLSAMHHLQFAEGTIGRNAIQTMRQGLGQMGDGIATVARNEFEHPAATVGASLVNLALPKVPSVLVTTALRQVFSYGLTAGVAHGKFSEDSLAAAGGMVAFYPVVALLAGGVRDQIAGTATPTSIRSRAIMATLTASAAVTALCYKEMIAGAATQLSAFTAYTFGRDVMVQSPLRLDNPNTAGMMPDATHFAIISVVYGIIQMVYNYAATAKASPSGPAAFDAGAGPQLGNAAKRGGMNFVGEWLEEVVFHGIDAVRKGYPMRIKLKAPGFERNHVVNQMLGVQPTRAGILIAGIVISDLLSRYLPGQSGAAANITGAVTFGFALNAIFYEPFANTGSAQPGPRQAAVDSETGSTASARTSTAPNITMTDAAAVEEQLRRSRSNLGGDSSFEFQSLHSRDPRDLDERGGPSTEPRIVELVDDEEPPAAQQALPVPPPTVQPATSRRPASLNAGAASTRRGITGSSTSLPMRSRPTDEELQTAAKGKSVDRG
jgi:hypothetical protein